MSPLDCFQPFLSPPVILVTPSHKTPEIPQDAMAVWMEDSREDSFKICLKESKIFDGVHKDIEVVSLLHVILSRSKKASFLKMIITISSLLYSTHRS